MQDYSSLLIVRPTRTFDVRLRHRSGRAFLILKGNLREISSAELSIWDQIDGVTTTAELVARRSDGRDMDSRIATTFSVCAFLKGLEAAGFLSLYADDGAAADDLALCLLRPEHVPALRLECNYRAGPCADWPLAQERLFQVMAEMLWRSSDAGLGAILASRLGHVWRTARIVAERFSRDVIGVAYWEVNWRSEAIRVKFRNSLYEGCYRHRH